MKILCVCFGNTCRSPLFQVLLQEELQKKGIEASIKSAGILQEEGAPAADEAVACMAERGLDLSSHKSRYVGSLDLASYDKIFCLDAKVAELLESGGGMPIERIEVENPYKRGLKTYRECAEILSRAAAIAAEKLAKL